jgi:hypothetical protein
MTSPDSDGLEPTRQDRRGGTGASSPAPSAAANMPAQSATMARPLYDNRSAHLPVQGGPEAGLRQLSAVDYRTYVLSGRSVMNHVRE